MNTLKSFEKNIPLIEEKIGYKFFDKNLLVYAFSHPSFVNENKNIKENNERLEFLGDSIFNLIISEYIYKKFPKKTEGEMSFIRSFIVDWSTCLCFIKKKGLEKYLLLGKGELFSKRGKESILADLFEAIIGAIYLDGGLSSSKKFLNFFYPIIDKMIKNPKRNYKSELQNYFQKKYQKLPIYKVINEKGPDHLKIFEVEVFFEKRKIGNGLGKSKNSAQQQAAKDALENFIKK